MDYTDLLLVLACFSMFGVLIIRRREHAREMEVQRGLERDARERKQYYRTVFANAGVGILRLDGSGTIVEANESFQEFIGYAFAELKTMSIGSLVHPEDREAMMAKAMVGVTGELSGYRAERRYVRKDGCIRWADVRTSVIRDTEGGFQAFIAVVVDITERKEGELILREGQEKMQQITENLAAAVFQLARSPDGSYSFSYLNEEIEVLLGLERPLVLNSANEFFTRIHPEDTPQLEKVLAASAQRLEKWSCDFRLNHTDGRLRWLIGKGIPHRGENGIVIWNGYFSDITERRHLDQKFRAIFDSSFDAYFLLDTRSRTLDCNATAIKTFQASGRDEVLTLGPLCFSPETQADGARSYDRFQELLAETLKNGHSKCEWQFRVRGRNMPADMTLIRLDVSQPPIILVVIHDLTERKQAEAEVVGSRNLLRGVIDNSIAVICAKDADGRYLLVNRKWGEILNLQESDVIGKLDTEIFPVEQARDYRRNDLEVLENLKPLTIEEHAVIGGERRTFLAVKFPIIDADGKARAVCGISTDITELKNIQEDLREARRQADAANQAKSQFLANMSHEIRTPMNAIMGMAYLALQTELPARTRDYLQKIQGAAKGLLGIINEILDFSKIEVGKLTLEQIEFDLERVVDNVSGMISLRAQEKGLEFLLAIDPGVPRHLIGDPLRLEQVLVNLTSNAVKFTEAGEVVVQIHARTSAKTAHSTLPTGAEKVPGTLRAAGAQPAAGASPAAGVQPTAGSSPAAGVQPTAGSSPAAGVQPTVGSSSAAGVLSAPGVVPSTVPLSAVDAKSSGSVSGTREIGELPPVTLAPVVTIEFQVRDTGVGLTPEQIQGLFQPFTQADGSTTRKYGGTGLGLSICKRLVESMKGTIAVTSEPGKGSCFHFSAEFGIAEGAIAHVPSPDLRHLRVLVVDDHAASREYLKNVLASLSFDVIEAEDGRSALTILEKNPPEHPIELILMDWQMPGIDGIETARRIQARGIPDRTPTIIMVTAFGRDQAMAHAGTAQIDEYLVKPVTPSTLFETIMRVFKKEHPQRKVEAAGPAAVGDLSRLRGVRALLVEDNELNQEVAVTMLTRIGMDVRTAENGLLALEALEQHPFDLVLMDCQMPEMDGYECTRRIRTREKFARLPVIAMTANAVAGDRERCIATGMNDHIPKPIDPDHLFRVLLTWSPSGNKPAGATGTGKPDSAGKAETVLASSTVAPAGTGAAHTPDLEDLPGIDVAGALPRLSGDREMLRGLLRKFRNRNLDFMTRVNEAIAAQKWTEAQRLAHTLKGVAATIGARDLPQRAAELEHSLREQQCSETTLQAVEAGLTDLLNQIAVLASPNEALPATIATASMTEILPIAERLLQALRADDGASAQHFTELRAKLGEDAGLTAELLRLEQLIGQYAFDEAVPIVETLLRKWHV